MFFGKKPDLLNKKAMKIKIEMNLQTFLEIRRISVNLFLFPCGKKITRLKYGEHAQE